VSDDKKGSDQKPQQPREPVRKIEEGSRDGRFNDGATRTTDWVKPERPPKK